MRRRFAIEIWVRAGDRWRRHDSESADDLAIAQDRGRAIRDGFVANGVEDTIVVVVGPNGAEWACGASRLPGRTLH